MAQYTWSLDAPTGVYKNRALSAKIFDQSLEESVCMPYVQPVTDYGRRQGESVTLTRVATITEPTSGILTESQRIPEDEFSISTVQVTVSEYGRSVPFTSFARDLSALDLQNAVQRRLKDQQKLTLDTAVASVFKEAKIKYIPTGVGSSTFDTDGTASTTASANWNVFHVEEVRDYMYDTLYVPPYEGDDYIAIFRNLGARGIKRDPDWEQWHIYTDPQAKLNNEIGRIENVRHIVTNHAQAFAKKANSVLGEGVVFGADGVAMAEVITPELRAQVNQGQDFGRNHAVAWYGILGFALIWDTANAGEARVIHVTSA